MELLPYRRKTQFYETDQMGIIHHANYLRWFEEARGDFMEQIGYNYRRVNDEGIDIAMLAISCEYKSKVLYGETVEIHTATTNLTPTRMTVIYRVLDAHSGILRTTGETKHCFISRAKGRPVSLKRELPELYELFCKYAPEASSV